MLSVNQLSIFSVREILTRIAKTEVIHTVADVEVLRGGNTNAIVY